MEKQAQWLPAYHSSTVEYKDGLPLMAVPDTLTVQLPPTDYLALLKLNRTMLAAR